VGSSGQIPLPKDLKLNEQKLNEDGSFVVQPPPPEVPRELSKVSLPPYVIEPPDILLIDAIKIVPKSPHTIETFDVLAIRVEGTLVEQPIAGTYSVDPEGKVDLGPAYGRVPVIDMTTDEARSSIDRHLRKILQNPEVSVSLAASAGAQRIEGEHLVGPDGTVNLGTYGSVYVTGKTLAEARAAIESQLSNHLENPEVTVDVFAYNSKVYYVITEGAGFGDNVIRQPVTGNETVLDAVAAIGGLAQTSSTKLWISRPAPGGSGCEQILPISWRDITRGASTDTNYQILPGDRLFISEDKFVAFDSLVSKLTRPFERIFGFNILGTQMVARFNRLPQDVNNF
jgi:polysaccharide export outer membrane protein